VRDHYEPHAASRYETIGGKLVLMRSGGGLRADEGIDLERIDDAVLALLRLGCTTAGAPRKASIGTRWAACTAKA
jgi:hypothetical protein